MATVWEIVKRVSIATGARAQGTTHVSLLDSEGLEDVGGLADLPQELCVRELDVLSGLVGLPDDGDLFP